MRDISEDAAIIADMIPVVKARFVEAFDTSEHAYRPGGPAGAKSFWPASRSNVDTDEDAPVHWRPSAAAISRSHETLGDWLLVFVDDPEHRKLLLAWSASIAAPRRYGSFARFCRKTGRVRRTADRRLLSAFSIVAALINKNGLSLQGPDLRRVSTLARFSDTELDRIREHVSDSAARPNWWRADDAKPRHIPEEHEPANDADRRQRVG